MSECARVFAWVCVCECGRGESERERERERTEKWPAIKKYNLGISSCVARPLQSLLRADKFSTVAFLEK